MQNFCARLPMRRRNKLMAQRTLGHHLTWSMSVMISRITRPLVMAMRLAIAICAIALWSTAIHAAGSGSPWGAKYFPNHVVKSHEGKSYRFYDDLVKDKIVVVNFIYTNCPDICGLQTARMAIVQDLLGDRLGKDIFIYSISLDPVRDTPKVLRDYATAFGAKKGWLFLTGESEKLHQVRYKLGERSRSLAEHRNDAVLGNDKTGEWGRSSIMSNLKVLTKEILDMDPATRKIRQPVSKDLQSGSVYQSLLGRHKGEALFLKACSACHTIGMGDHIGPDLEGVGKRREMGWLIDYLMAPDVLRKRGDPIALSIGSRFKGVSMPNLSLSKRDAQDLVSYIDAQTKRLARRGASTEAAHKHHQH